MAKKKWNFNAQVRGKNLKGSHKLFYLGVETDIRLVANADITFFNPTFPGFDTTEIFIETLKENKFEAVELNGLLSEHIVEILPYIKGVKYLWLNKCNRIDDLSFIEELGDLRGLEIYWNQKATRLPDFSKISHLTRFTMVEANKITDFSGLVGSNIEELMMWGCNFFGNFTPKLVIPDFKIFTGMPKLRDLNLVPVKNTDSAADLRALSQLRGLEQLRFLDGYFTFEQFAWLSSKLPEAKGLEPISEYENWDHEAVWSVIGRRKPKSLKKHETAHEYEAHFYALAEKYKTRENPPSDDEKD